MTASRLRRTVIATAVLALAVPVLAACHSPKPYLGGLPLDAAYGSYPDPDGVLHSTPTTYAILGALGGGLNDAVTCYLRYYLVDGATGAHILLGESGALSAKQDSVYVEVTWPFQPLPGSYRIYARCGGAQSDNALTAIVRKRARTVTWAPATSITSVNGQGVFTPSAAATATNGGTITYAVSGSTGAAGCSLADAASPPAIRVQGNGTCTVKAAAAAAELDQAGSTEVTFTISAFADPVPEPGPAPAPAPAPTPTCPEPLILSPVTGTCT